MRERTAQPDDLGVSNENGIPDGHFLRKLKAIAKKAGVEGAELHGFRKTETLHEEGVSVNTIRIRLGHESLDVTLAYWTQKGSHHAGLGRIFRSNIQGPQGQSAENRKDIDLLYDNLPEPIDLDLKGSNVHRDAVRILSDNAMISLSF